MRARGSAVFLILGVGVPALVLAFVDQSASATELVLPGIVTAYAAGRIASTVTSMRSQPMALTFWLFGYAFLGVAGLAQASTRSFPLLPTTDPRLDVVTAYACILASFIAFDLATANSRRPAAPLGILANEVRERRLRILTLLGVLVAASVVVGVVGIRSLFSPRVVLAEQLAIPTTLGIGSLPLLAAAVRVPVSVAFLGWLVIWKRRPQAPASRWASRWLVALGVLALLVNNPISTPRYWIATVGLAAAFIALPPTTRDRRAWYAFTVVAIVFLAMPSLDAFRWTTTPSIEVPESAISVVDSLDFDSVEQLAGAAGLVERTGHKLGEQSIGLLAFWVPRGLWPDKPEATSTLVADFLDYPIRNIALPLQGFLFVEGGLALVAIGFFLYGKIIARVDSSHAVGGGRYPLSAVAVPMLAGYQFFLLRGDILPATAYLLPMIACLLAIASPAQSLGEGRRPMPEGQLPHR